MTDAGFYAPDDDQNKCMHEDKGDYCMRSGKITLLHVQLKCPHNGDTQHQLCILKLGFALRDSVISWFVPNVYILKVVTSKKYFPLATNFSG